MKILFTLIFCLWANLSFAASPNNWYVDPGSGNDNNAADVDAVLEQQADGASDATGLILTSALADFQTSGVDSDNYIHWDYDNANTDEQFCKISSVDSETQITLTAAVTGNLSNVNYTVGGQVASIQEALDNIPADTTNGDQINVKAGTADTLVASLDIDGAGKYGNPVVAAMLIIRGYTTVANDGGIGAIDCENNHCVNDTAVDYVSIIDMHIYDFGSNEGFDVDNGWMFENCEFDDGTDHAIESDTYTVVINCHFHNIGKTGVTTTSSSFIYHSYFENGTNDFSGAIVVGSHSRIVGNVIKVDGASHGIRVNDDCSVIGNTIWSNGGTGQGIKVGSGDDGTRVLNNIVEGFSGSGGKGIELTSGGTLFSYGGNAYYNNEDDEDLSGDVLNNLGNNDTLTASCFTDPANDDFSVNTDAGVKADAEFSTFKGSSTNQYMDKGAAQRQEAGGGSWGFIQ